MDPFPLTGDLDWIVRQSTYQSEGLRDLHVRQLRGVGSVPRRLRGSLTVVGVGAECGPPTVGLRFDL